LTVATVLAQLDIQDPAAGDASCVAENGFCPGWIADNFDRYLAPLGEHVFLTVVSVAIGFGIAMLLALLAHRRRWLTGPIITSTGSSTRSPPSRPSSCCSPSPVSATRRRSSRSSPTRC
jgi:hypothetical protein